MKSLLSTFAILLITSFGLAQSPSQDIFWNALHELCRKAYKGVVIYVPENDTLFSGKELLLHVRDCDENRIRIPLIVGDDRSRTWMLTYNESGLSLKHDHRHEDGTEDDITQYGGVTANKGSATVQLFPADQYTADLIPVGATNVWWIELVPGSHFTYSLRRLGTERFFSLRFDLTEEVDAPEVPWGWKE